MKVNTFISAATSLVAFATPSYAFWRMSCPGRIVTERADPIVTPGGIASHVHTIAGGNGFALTMDYNSTQSSECSSCPIKQDLSNYWTPSLYYMAQNGSYISVPQAGDGNGVQGGMTVYYLQRGGPNNDNLTAYPEGFRMLAGTPTKRAYTDDFAGQAVSFVCLNYSSTSPYSNGLPSEPCPDGLRAQIFFPSCWDGVNLDSADHSSHMAYPTMYSYDNGPCPASHPVHMVSIFFEVIWSTAGFDWWTPDDGYQPFVFSNGDPTGYGFHGDFSNGRNVSALQEATDTCLDDSGLITDCPVFDFFTDVETNGCIVAPTIQEEVYGVLDSLPGCNVVQYANATKQTCNQTATIGAPQVYYKNVTGWNYLGCGVDVTGNRTFSADQWWDNSVTVEGCLNYCGGKGYSYAGLEYSNQCFCSNTLAADRAPVSGILGNCFSPCAGNSSEYCGGSNRISMYYQNNTYVPLNITSKTISCPGSNNTQYLSSNGTFQVQCGIDRAGGDIGMSYVPVNNITACMDSCANTYGCSFVSLSGSACYMKGGVLKTPLANSNVLGAYIVTAATSAHPQTSTVSSTSTSATSKATFSSATVSSATSTGSAVSVVQAVASSSSAAAQSTSTAAPSCPGSNSTYYQATSGSIFLIECGIDHAGGDMASTSVSSFQGCIEACSTTTGCVDVSLSGSACYMKKTLGAAVYGNGGILGAKFISSGSSSSSSSLYSSSASSTSSTTSSSSSSVASSVATTSATTSSVSSTVSSSAKSTITTGPVVGSDGITTVQYAPSCTAINTNTYAVTDSAGVAYLYMCGAGTGGTTMAVSSGVANWDACFALCDSATGCSGFTYNQGAVFGNGTGQCLLKGGNPNSFASTDNMLSTRVGAVIRSYITISSMSTSTTPASTVATSTSAVSAATGNQNFAQSSAASSSAKTSSSASASSTSSSSSAQSSSTFATSTIALSTISTSSSTSASVSPSSTVTSAVCPQNNNTIYVDPTTSYQFFIECGIDRAGGDLSMTYVNDLNGCIAACATTAGCVDVSLSGTACYMKSAQNAAQQNGGVYGAKLLGSRSTPSASAVASTSSAAAVSSSSSAAASQAASTTSSAASAVGTKGPPIAQS